MIPADDETGRAQAARIAAWTRLAGLFLLAGLLVVLGRVAQLKTAPGPRLREAMVPRLSTRPQLARRGDLVDARGRVLATSTVGYRLFVDPAVVEDVRTVAVDLAAILDADPVAIDRKIVAGAGRRYVVIDHLLTDGEVESVRAAGLRGVGLEPRLVRSYPHGEAAATVVGLVGFEHTGLSGSEHAFDTRLAARRGRLTYLRDARRRALWIEPQGYEPAGDGRDVRLSIDLVVQEIADRHLRAAVETYDAAGGRAVVLDVRTGGILAMCDVRAGDAAGDTHPALARNRCVTDPYEPGSTMKPFIWAAVTELGRARPDEVLPTPADGPYRTPYGRRIRDSHYHGPATWRTVLVKSLNTGMAMVAERLTHAEMREAIDRFGFGHATRCGVAGETAGLVTPPERWSDYTQSSVSFGHEIAVTPVQMARAFAAFARDGTLPPVSITAPVPQDARFRFVRRACGETVAREVREILGEVMVEGTGRPAQSRRYRLFGKSGTAQLPRSEGGGYHEDRYVSSFVAGAPFAAPRLVVLCVIDDPDRSRGHWGGVIAGPVVRDVIDETLAYLGVPPDRPPAVVASVD